MFKLWTDMKLWIAGWLIGGLAWGATLADDEIALLLHRIEVLSSMESPGPRADTLLRAAELLQGVDLAKSAEFSQRAKSLRSFQPLPLSEQRRPLEQALAGSNRDEIEMAASRFLHTVEHSKESPDDYSWFAAMRRKFDIITGSDNASVRAREALAEIADLVNTSYDFRLTDLQGTPLTLKDQLGKTVLIAFWATWCGPCQEELPVLERLWRERGIAVLAVTDESPEVVQHFIAERHYTFPVLMDPSRTVFDHYHVQAMPASVIVDRTGRLRAHLSKVTEVELLRCIQLAATS